MTWIRNSRPENGNKFYNTRGVGGYSSCIVGNPTVTGLNVLCNCVGCANGAFNETYVKNTSNAQYKEHYPLNREAKYLIDKARSLGLPILPPNAIPPLGGLIVWGGTANHVAYISAVKDNGNTITVQQSAYGINLTRFPWWEWYIRDYHRNKGGKDAWEYGGTCLGFIVNPAIGGVIDPDPNPKDSPSRILNVTQLSDTNLSIHGAIGGVIGVTTNNILYYKWDSDSVDKDNNDGSIYSLSGAVPASREYTVQLQKPRYAKRIAICPYQVNTGYDSFPGNVYHASLKASIPCIYVCTHQIRAQGIPYIFTNGEWKKGVPAVYTNKQWHTIYNTEE